MSKMLRFTEVLAGPARMTSAPAVLTLGLEDRRRSRQRIRIDDGREAALMLPRGTILHDGDTLRVGGLAVVAHFTGGHTPGGTTWSWRSCEGARCANIVYADSFTPVSDDEFLFTRNTGYPRVLDDFAHSFGLLDTLPCDLLLTPHPGASRLWERLAKRDSGDADALLAPGQCAAYAAAGRNAVAARVKMEQRGP